MSDTFAELVFGFVYAVGTDAGPVIDVLKDYLRQYNYITSEFRVSRHLQTLNLGLTFDAASEYDRMGTLMNAGNKAREKAQSDNILAVMAVNDIADGRPRDAEGLPKPKERIAHLVRSLKTPDEVQLLRQVYRPGFFLVGIASNDDEQMKYLTRQRGLTDEEAKKMMERDEDEKKTNGQRTRDTFYLADVFVELTGERYKDQLDRFLELVFGHPFKTPTKEEHAMFMAYASAARSAQFGRQVGAAITSNKGDVVAVGFNEVPAPGGGPYWEGVEPDCRDHKRKIDSNFEHRDRIVGSIMGGLSDKILDRPNVRKIFDKLHDLEHRGQPEAPPPLDTEARINLVAEDLTTDKEVRRSVHGSDLKDITEYGRAVHAEMDSLLTCARLGIGTEGKHLFTTTFPCHNCTRHIIAAGIASVTYIEPYPKSKAADLHPDAICFDREQARKESKVPFMAFVGVGPRRYLDLFSIDLSTGARIERKDSEGHPLVPPKALRPPRVPMLPLSYLEREDKALEENEAILQELEGGNSETQPTNGNGMEPPANR